MNKEGYLCPICKIDYLNVENLQKHFERKHSSSSSNSPKPSEEKTESISEKKEVKIGCYTEHTTDFHKWSDDRQKRSQKRLLQIMESFQQLNGTTNGILEQSSKNLNNLLPRTIMSSLSNVTPLSVNKKFANSSNCSCCGRSVNVFSHRRHHCRLCYGSICSNCSYDTTTMMLNRMLYGKNDNDDISLKSVGKMTEQESQIIRMCSRCKQCIGQHNFHLTKLNVKHHLTRIYSEIYSKIYDIENGLLKEYDHLNEQLTEGSISTDVHKVHSNYMKCYSKLRQSINSLNQHSRDLVDLAEKQSRSQQSIPSSQYIPLPIAKNIKAFVSQFVQQYTLKMSSFISLSRANEFNAVYIEKIQKEINEDGQELIKEEKKTHEKIFPTSLKSMEKQLSITFQNTKKHLDISTKTNNNLKKMNYSSTKIDHQSLKKNTMIAESIKIKDPPKKILSKTSPVHQQATCSTVLKTTSIVIPTNNNSLLPKSEKLESDDKKSISMENDHIRKTSETSSKELQIVGPIVNVNSKEIEKKISEIILPVNSLSEKNRKINRIPADLVNEELDRIEILIGKAKEKNDKDEIRQLNKQMMLLMKQLE
ncbi:hypothetical protein SNEBB_001227 [Seison nebaliae]|nr:hypothetical protein SNEBB_001227 [Seison nebaliae]